MILDRPLKDLAAPSIKFGLVSVRDYKVFNWDWFFSPSISDDFSRVQRPFQRVSYPGCVTELDTEIVICFSAQSS